MARPLLVPAALLTLVGLAPVALASSAAPTPRSAVAPAGAPTSAPSAAPAAPQAVPATALVGDAIVATTRSGNARAPSYDDGMLQTKAEERTEVVTSFASLPTLAPPAPLLLSLDAADPVAPDTVPPAPVTPDPVAVAPVAPAGDDLANFVAVGGTGPATR